MRRAAMSFGETLYRLDELVERQGESSANRDSPTDEDADLVVGWLDAFFVEAFGSRVESRRVSGTARRHRRRRRARGAVDGERRTGRDGASPRLPAWGCRGSVRSTRRPEHRGRGHGAAVTAEAVRHAQRLGARDVVLFADVANSVANGIYRRLGFVAVGENVQYAFTA